MSKCVRISGRCCTFSYNCKGIRLARCFFENCFSFERQNEIYFNFEYIKFRGGRAAFIVK